MQSFITNFDVEYSQWTYILVVKMSEDGHNCGFRFIVLDLSDLGFNVDVGSLFSTPQEVKDMATDSDVHKIGIFYQAVGN